MKVRQALISYIILTIISLLVTEIYTANYAVIAVTTGSYINYRHQSYALSIYKTLIANGMPKENIIMMMQDDIAFNIKNPFPGKVFSSPDRNGEGINLYSGVLIDYKGKDVTSLVFLDVIAGRKSQVEKIGTGRVLNSGANDTVIIYLIYHGAPGVIMFQKEDFLYANHFALELEKMSLQKKYKKLLLELKAEDSISLLTSLPKSFELTASVSYSDTAWSIFCSSDAVVNGINIRSCLGYETNNRYNQLDNTQSLEYLKGLKIKLSSSTDLLKEFLEDMPNKREFIDIRGFESPSDIIRISSYDANLKYFYEQLNSDSNFISAKKEFDEELNQMKLTEAFFKQLITNMNIDITARPFTTNFSCFKISIDSFKHCRIFKENSLRYLRAFYNICAIKPQIEVGFEIIKACQT